MKMCMILLHKDINPNFNVFQNIILIQKKIEKLKKYGKCLTFGKY